MPGTVVADAELGVVEVPEGSAAAYVGPDDNKDAAQIASVVAPGEFVAVSSLAEERSDGSILVIPLMSAAPATLGKGSHAQVWRVRQEQPDGVESVAELVADDVLIASIAAPETMMLDQMTAEIRVGSSQIAPILAVLGSQDGLVLVEGGTP